MSKRHTIKPSSHEQHLINRCRQSDRRAQQELYDRYKDAMYTLAYRITSDFALAEDVLQEAFLAVFRGIDTFRAESTLGAWIKTIVVRTAYRKLKKQMSYDSLENLGEAEPRDFSLSLDIEHLEQAIQSLPTGYRSVFVLSEVEGYSHKEIAELLNIAEGTSKSQLHHARKLLRKRVRSLEEELMTTQHG